MVQKTFKLGDLEHTFWVEDGTLIKPELAITDKSRDSDEVIWYGISEPTEYIEVYKVDGTWYEDPTVQYNDEAKSITVTYSDQTTDEYASIAEAHTGTVLEIHSIDPPESPPKPGEKTSAVINLQSEGREGGAYTIHTYIDGDELTTFSGTIGKTTGKDIKVEFTCPDVTVFEFKAVLDGIPTVRNINTTKADETGSPKIVIDNVSVPSDPVVPGEEAVITVDISNNGTAEGLADYDIFINGSESGETIHQNIPAGGSGTYDIYIYAPSTETVEVGVGDIVKTFETTLNQGANILVKNLDGPVRGTTVGTERTITFQMVNEGDSKGTASKDVVINGNVEKTVTQTLDPGASIEVTVKFVIPDTQSVDVSVGSKNISFSTISDGNGGTGEPSFTVTDIWEPLRTPHPGVSSEFTAVVENTSSVGGVANYDVIVNGNVHESIMGTVPGEDSENFHFWVKMPEAETVTVEVGDFSVDVETTYDPGGTGDASFTVDEIWTPGTTPSPGDQASLEVKVSNTGNADGATSYDIIVNGSTVGTLSKTVPAGETKYFDVSITTPETEQVNFQVGGVTEKFGTTYDPGGTGEASFVVESIAAPKDTPSPGDKVSLVTTITNTGDAGGTTSYDVYVNGSVAGTINKTTSAGETVNIGTQITIPETEEVTFKVGNKSVTFDTTLKTSGGDAGDDIIQKVKDNKLLVGAAGAAALYAFTRGDDTVIRRGY
jgi:hypothetical protein